MTRTVRIIRAAFDEGVYIAGVSATAFGMALLLESVLVAVLGP